MTTLYGKPTTNGYLIVALTTGVPYDALQKRRSLMDDDLRQIRRFVIGLFIAVLLLGGIATVVSRAFDLAWFPWQVKMQTGMIRNSNSYVTTQQEALRQFRTSYEDATTDAQRFAIARQMHEIADLIPDNVQTDIASFLSNH